MMKCPACTDPSPHRVIYYGLPHWLCRDEECSCFWGFWSYFTVVLPFNGWFLMYTGSYWTTLWVWLTGKADVE